jgi:hypothetical protein
MSGTKEVQEMNRLKTMAAVSCLVMLSVLFPPGTKADEWDKKTEVTVNEPFEIPGMVLGPGKYVFKLMDSDSDRNIVQILNEREDHIYATLLAIPSYRMDPTNNTAVTFWERSASTPPALRTWFYPGDHYGEEFVYHKPKALEIAQRVHQPVLAMPAATGPNLNELRKVPLVAVTPNAQEMQVAQVTAPAKPSSAGVGTSSMTGSQTAMAPTSRKHLPGTASNLPLVALIGILSLGAAITLRAVDILTAGEKPRR